MHNGKQMKPEAAHIQITVQMTTSALRLKIAKNIIFICFLFMVS